MPVHESDICIIGGGITAAMLAEKLSELRPGLAITVVEAGRSIFDAQNRGRYRERALEVAAGLQIGDWGKVLALSGRTGFRLLGPLATR